MFDATSRYVDVGDATMTVADADGRPRVTTYKRRRFLPSTEDLITVLVHTVTEGERLDNITARYLEDPTQFWRICDANEVFHPDELTESVGREIHIAMPGP